MANTPPGNFLEGIFYEDSVPLEWRFLSSLPTPTEQLHLTHKNCQVLQALLSMDSMIHESDDEVDPSTHELVRLDNKLNLLLGMVGKLLAQTLQMPDPVTVCIGASAMQFELSAEQVDILAAHPGQAVMLEIYFNSQLPEVVNLCAELSVKSDTHAVAVALAKYRDMEPKVLELLEKYIFRQHRRSIAQSKNAHSY